MLPPIAPRFARQFHATLKTAKLGPQFSRELQRCLQSMASETLPHPSDRRVRIPPVLVIEWARAVPGTGNSVWLYYKVNEEGRLTFMRVTRETPPRLDDDDW